MPTRNTAVNEPIDLNNSLEDRLTKNSNSLLGGITKVLLILTSTAFLVGFLSSCAAPPEATNTQATPTPVATVQQSEEAKKRKDWGDQMLRKPAPKKGCFDA